MKLYIQYIVFLFLCYSLAATGQTPSLKWKFKTGDKVISSPVVYNDLIYFGSEDGNFYAVDLEGNEKWRLHTAGKIRSKAIIAEGILFFESGNIFYALNPASGKKLWIYDPADTLYANQIDPYDDKRPSGTLHEGIIYVGSSSGTLYGFDTKTGKIRLKINTDNASPIRSTPIVQDNRLYFGDWNGVVYCRDLKQDKYLWKKKTYSFDKPYSTFGGIASEFVIFQDLLFFGARNFVLNVLRTDSGEKEWTYIESNGGWVIGDPVIYDNKLYLGGSDNHKILALDPITGQLLWDFNAGQNIYAKPVVTKDKVIFTSGPIYKPNDPGGLWIVDRAKGKLIAKVQMPKGAYSAPVMVGQSILFGCNDGNIYCFSLE
ncbi:protein kinase [Fulvivirga imtechensis AK7]|uniref:Protein kinase n=1 Tax=Fulvivirga imtechensis AK7 TaxID=1237149 RepID=L8JS09_9BACT|nr:PQQ-binding-like beta-propeller repeat protein [Fulvivirga imtechensis]ELR70244.1 protein kinase [Fulvivirga imtechensis AK7]